MPLNVYVPCGIQKSIKFPSLLILRRFATAGEPIDHHSKHSLHPWPKSKKPTPYEIFQIDDKDQNLSVLEFNKILKKKYTSYVKIYHPDVASKIDILDSKQNTLTPQMKRNRFDEIMNAYELLKDPRRRVAYNKFKDTTWDTYSPQAGSFDAYRLANAHRKKYNFENDEEFWRAGTWEDYYNMKFKRTPPTREELDKNKYKILAGVLAVAGLTLCLQLMLAFNKSYEVSRETALLNLKALRDLQQSTDNYGEGRTPFQRLKRFLLYRRSTFASQDEARLRDLEEQDRQLLVKYAQQQVSKF